METIDIQQAETDLDRLVERLANEGGFIITKAGKPVAKLVLPCAFNSSTVTRLGFMTGQVLMPRDFDRMGGDEIEGLFDSDPHT